MWEDLSALWSCGKGTRGLSAVEGLGVNSHLRTGVVPVEWSASWTLTHFEPGSGGFSVWLVIGFGLDSWSEFSL